MLRVHLPFRPLLVAQMVALVLFSSASSWRQCNAEDVVLVKDINTNPRALEINGRCRLGSTELLIADDGIRGAELWIGDGLAGTRLVKDINPGSAGSFPNNQCVTLGNSVIFAGNNGTSGSELWISDGTTAGTVMLKEIRPGAQGSSLGGFLLVANKVLFSANDGTNGTELWITDGTAAGTSLVKDISTGSSSANPSSFTAVSDSLVFFAATSVAEGRELWRTDGTATGTTLVKDIRAGATGSNPDHFAVLGLSVFFSASTTANGREPWVSDGTDGGTFILADVFPGGSDGFYSSFENPGVINGVSLFTGRTTATGYELFSSNGTSAGTGLLKDIDPGSNSSFPQNYRKVGNRVIFSAQTVAANRELYVTDGTGAGTVLVTDLNPGPLAGSSLDPSRFLVDNSKIILAGSVGPESSQRIYSWDNAALTLLTDLFPGAEGVDPPYFQTATSKGLAIGVPRPADSFPGPGYVLTDGTTAGTRIHPGTLGGFTETSSVVPMMEVNGKLIVAASDGSSGMELWSTDGTPSGTTRLTDINPGLGSSVIPSAGFEVVSGKLLFVASNAASGAELWVTDGTAAGTSLLKDIEAGAGSAFEGPSTRTRKFFKVGSKIVFSAKTAASGYELWVSDGTASGTSIIAEIRPGSNSAIEDGVISGAVSNSSFGATLFFVADDGVRGDEVWATTTTVTGITSDIVVGSSGSNPRYLTPLPFGGSFLGVVFRACPSSTGCEVYITTGGAPTFIDVVPGASGSNPEQFVFPSESRLFFVGSTGSTGDELMKSDTPFSAATLVKDIVTGSTGSNITGLTALNSSTVFFSACSTSSGGDCEPWRSDGTAGGTVLIKDLNPGTGSSFYGYSGARVLNGIAYFQAVESDSVESARYYRSDGTSAGTLGLTSQGFQYFSTDDLPSPYTPALGTLFFPAASSSYGVELFKIGDDQCPADPAKSVPGLCGCGTPESDGDGDGAVDCLEQCPSDPLKRSAGSCGCGAAETDGDADGTPDCVDQCPADPLKQAVGSCGCGAPETDGDGDGTPNCVDLCLTDPIKAAPGACGCGIADGDANANGVPDCIDNQLSTVVPAKARVKFSKKKTDVSLQARSGVTYEVQFAVVNKGAKIGSAKFRKKRVTRNTLGLKLPPSGKILLVRYRYIVPGTAIASQLSPLARKTRR